MDQESEIEILLSSDEEYFYFEYDGELSFQDYYSSEYESDNTNADSTTSKIIGQTTPFRFPKPMNYTLFKTTNDIDEMFNNHVTIFSLPSRWIKRKENCKINVKLCRHYLLNKKCDYYNSCKFSHHYCNITRCKYDHCKKTKLVGDGVFINTNSNICKMRHHMETLNSFIYRTRQMTNFDLHLHVYSEFLDEFKKSFTVPMKCQQLWIYIT